MSVRVEKNQGVWTIIHSRPESRNAMDPISADQLTDAFLEFNQNEDGKVGVFWGEGGAFCSGWDLKYASTLSGLDALDPHDFPDKGVPPMALMGPSRLNLSKPIIAAVSGFALGGGCELAMMCDFIIASDTAKFGQPEINLGVIPGIGGTQRLTKAIGKSKAMEMNLTGRFMDAVEAERAGLVSRIVSVNELMTEVKGIAQKIAGKSLITTMAIKESVNRSFETSLSEGLLFERRSFHALFSTEDQKEGMTAFVEKRSPRFRDK